MTALEITIFRKEPATHRQGTVSFFVLHQLPALSVIAAGTTFLVWGADGFYWIVAAIFLSFLAAFMDLWLLVIEIHQCHELASLSTAEWATGGRSLKQDAEHHEPPRHIIHYIGNQSQD
jgi:hypothetical protein